MHRASKVRHQRMDLAASAATVLPLRLVLASSVATVLPQQVFRLIRGPHVNPPFQMAQPTKRHTH